MVLKDWRGIVIVKTQPPPYSLFIAASCVPACDCLKVYNPYTSEEKTEMIFNETGFLFQTPLSWGRQLQINSMCLNEKRQAEWTSPKEPCRPLHILTPRSPTSGSPFCTLWQAPWGFCLFVCGLVPWEVVCNLWIYLNKAKTTTTKAYTQGGEGGKVVSNKSKCLLHTVWF